MEDFNYSELRWMDNLIGHKKSMRFLDFVDENFLLQEMQRPRRRSVMLNLVYTKKGGLAGNGKLKSSFGGSDHEMVEFNILGLVRRAHNKLLTLDFRRADVGLFRHLLGRVPQDPRKLVNIQALFPSSSRSAYPTDASKGSKRLV